MLSNNTGPMWADIHPTQQYQLEEIKQRLKLLEKTIMEIKNTLSVQPVAPLQPVKNSINRCTKCGIQLDTIMGYVCYNSPCPTGMGSVYSKVNNQYMDLNREQA